MKRIMILAILSLMILSACVSEPETQKNKTIDLEELAKAEAAEEFVAGWLQMDGTACLCMQWSNGYGVYDCKDISITDTCSKQATKELNSDVFCSICLQVQTKDITKVRELIEAGGENDN